MNTTDQTLDARGLNCPLPILITHKVLNTMNAGEILRVIIMKFEQHTVETAPDAAKPELKAAEKAFGSIPNLYRGFATSPATLKIYLSFNKILQEYDYLTPVEQQVVDLTISTENECDYCVGAHSVLAGMAKMPEPTLTELREQRPISDPKLDTLRRFTLSVMTCRGWVPEQELTGFQAVGYDQRHVLEILTILAQKTLINYYNHIAHTPLDEMFMSQEWVPNSKEAKEVNPS